MTMTRLLLVVLQCYFAHQQSAYLFKLNKKQHTVWVKRYLQKRPQYGAVNTLLPDLATSDDQSDRCNTCKLMDIMTFEELINYVIAS